ncbi:MAG: hypothetical protein JWN11_1049 [Hyphomicrobiales bacterium]|nr:hypothetical protein [Hyphomicrobiales bacterium]
MTFKFLKDDKTVEHGLRRIALGQLENALAELRSTDSDSSKIVHNARRRCKRLRGLIRLVRPSFPAYRLENQAIRDASAGLSQLRDAAVLPQTYDSLWKHTNLRPSGIARQWLMQHATTAAGDRQMSEVLVKCDDQLSAVGRRVGDWTLTADGFEAIGGGLKRVYVTMRAAMDESARRSDPVSFHEWRKMAKYHLHHLELLRASAPEVLSGFRECADQLSDVLGDHHNLVVLGETFDKARDFPELAEDLEAIDAAVDHKKHELEGQAFELGGELSAERPRAFVERYAQYWGDWRS